jgi:hypothetical protein
MESNKVSICCNVKCNERFTCAQFARALDVNSGKIASNYYEIDKCSYEKAK